MDVDSLEIVVTFLLGISLASERVITMLKTLIPALADNPGADQNTAWNQRWRPLIIQMLSFLVCCGTVALISGGLFTNWLTTRVTGIGLPVIVVGLLASGGSAFWNNFLGYTKAVKDIRKQIAADGAGGGGGQPAGDKVQVGKVVGEPAGV